MAELRRIDPVSMIKIAFCVLGALGITVGLAAYLLTVIISLQHPEHWVSPAIFGWVIPFLAGLAYGIGGALLLGLGAVIYNFLASRMGGIQVVLHFPEQNQQR
jgi:hypothetical protein